MTGKDLIDSALKNMRSKTEGKCPFRTEEKCPLCGKTGGVVCHYGRVVDSKNHPNTNAFIYTCSECNSEWLLHEEESTDSGKEQMEKRKEILDSKIKDFKLAWKEKNEFYTYPYVYGLIPMLGNYQFSFTDCSLSFLGDFIDFLNEDKSRLKNLEDSKYNFLEKIIDDFKKEVLENK